MKKERFMDCNAIVVIAGSCSLLCIFCWQRELFSKQEIVKVGFIGHLQVLRLRWNHARKGAQIAIEAINAEGGILGGKKLNLN